MGKQIIVNSKEELEKELKKSKNKKTKTKKTKTKKDEWKEYRAKKYGNVRVDKKNTKINTIFDSKSEYARYKELNLLVSAGIITDLKIHNKFILLDKYTNANGQKIQAMTYTADFTYMKDEKMIVEDVKGFITNDFKLKKKIFEFRYPELTIDIIKS